MLSNKAKLLLSFSFSFIFYTFGYSQNSTVSIQVVDSLTNQSLPYATLYLENKGIGTSTNLKGLARFTMENKLFSTDTISCSYVGYLTKRIPLSSSLSKNLIIRLKERIPL